MFNIEFHITLCHYLEERLANTRSENNGFWYLSLNCWIPLLIWCIPMNLMHTSEAYRETEQWHRITWTMKPQTQQIVAMWRQETWNATQSPFEYYKAKQDIESKGSGEDKCVKKIHVNCGKAHSRFLGTHASFENFVSSSGAIDCQNDRILHGNNIVVVLQY